MKEFKSFFKTVGGNEGGKCNYPTRLDTYGCGCQHDCPLDDKISYCDKRSCRFCWLRREYKKEMEKRLDGFDK